MSSRPTPASHSHHQASPPVSLELSSQAGPDPASGLAHILPAAARSLRAGVSPLPTCSRHCSRQRQAVLTLHSGSCLARLWGSNTLDQQGSSSCRTREPLQPLRGPVTSESYAYPAPHPSTGQSPFCLQAAAQRILGPHLLDARGAQVPAGAPLQLSLAREGLTCLLSSGSSQLRTRSGLGPEGPGNTARRAGPPPTPPRPQLQVPPTALGAPVLRRPRPLGCRVRVGGPRPQEWGWGSGWADPGLQDADFFQSLYHMI